MSDKQPWEMAREEWDRAVRHATAGHDVARLSFLRVGLPDRIVNGLPVPASYDRVILHHKGQAFAGETLLPSDMTSDILSMETRKVTGIYTSYYGNRKRTLPGIAISNGVPAWATNISKKMIELAPERHMIKDHGLTQEEWTEYFETKILSKLDPKKIALQVHGYVMLCWETPDKFCHRRLVAKWIEKGTGIVVPEWTVAAELPPDPQISLL